MYLFIYVYISVCTQVFLGRITIAFIHTIDSAHFYHIQFEKSSYDTVCKVYTVTSMFVCSIHLKAS